MITFLGISLIFQLIIVIVALLVMITGDPSPAPVPAPNPEPKLIWPNTVLPYDPYAYSGLYY